MDCAAEEQIVRSALSDLPGVRGFRFDLPARSVAISHTGDVGPIRERLEALRLGAELVGSEPAAEGLEKDADALERRTLILLLAINGGMFLVEQVAGWIAQSAGLLTDSLDMLADASIYGIALYAVGGSAVLKTRAAHASGWLQLLLAIGALAEVLRRFLFGSEPEPAYMMAVGLLALAANVTCLLMIARHRGGGAHMRASWIFSTNDVVANAGVIAAGALVLWSGSRMPDLVIGAIIAAVVILGAVRILRLR